MISAHKLTPDDVSPQTERRRGFKLRFSLVNMLLVVAVIAAVIAISSVSRERNALKREVQQLRQEMGQLEIDDPTKVQAIEIATLEDLTWRWRIFVPEGAPVYLTTRLGQITGTGLSGRSRGSLKLPEGEQVVTFAVRRNRHDKWQLIVHASETGDNRFGMDDQDIGWLQPDSVGLTWTGVARTQAFGVKGKPLVLLRCRERKPSSGGTPNPLKPNEPADGLLIWLDDRRAP